MIKYGTTRTCLLVGNWVIKLPYSKNTTRNSRLANFICGLFNNLREIEIHEKYKNKELKFCPILLKNPLLLIMKRAKPLLNGDMNNDSMLHFYDNIDENISDGKEENFGILDGKIVRIDYSDAPPY